MNKNFFTGILSQSLIIAITICALIAACDTPRLDGHLCPVGKSPSRQTIFLLDTSDPLTPKHRSELQRLLDEMLREPEPGNAVGEHFYVAPGEAIIVYELREELDTVEYALKVCNPGSNPDEWDDWKDGLTKGKAIASHQWLRLEENIEALFDEIKSSESQSSSPIIEMLGVIVPRHAPSKRSQSSEQIKRTHLIIFSDLLQHSSLLSHYGKYLAAKDIKTTDGLRSLQTDLTGIDVSLFRLERADSGQWQTTEHYIWWTDFVQELGGALMWQQSI